LNSDSSHSDDGSAKHLEVAVIGGGQAGLAIGYYLRQQGCRFVILERANALAPAWRERWDSLSLFTPRRYSALPGLPFPGDPDGYPTRDQVITYLERYAKSFELPIELNSQVKQLVRSKPRTCRSSARSCLRRLRSTSNRRDQYRQAHRSGPAQPAKRAQKGARRECPRVS
jgi:cation diffusion facilitator CzcD-associated flavoprotein CzcO